MVAENNRTVCVRGAGGYLASWLVKLLLSNGYTVHGTLRNPDDPKNAHLKSLDSAAQNLKAFKADLLDYDAIFAAIKGCDGVFHVASPVPLGSVQNPEEEVVKPAVEGTLNVLKACLEAKVKRIILVSSAAAVCINPSWPDGQAMDETSWSDLESCKSNDRSGYYYAKTMAECAAWEYAKQHGLDLVTLCPGIAMGPMLQTTISSSCYYLILLLSGGFEDLKNINQKLVDVRDVAEATKLVYERPEAEGRYICNAHLLSASELVQILKEIYPDYNYPTSFREPSRLGSTKVNSDKLKSLGWIYRPLKETLMDSVENFRQVGILS